VFWARWTNGIATRNRRYRTCCTFGRLPGRAAGNCWYGGGCFLKETDNAALTLFRFGGRHSLLCCWLGCGDLVAFDSTSHWCRRRNLSRDQEVKVHGGRVTRRDAPGVLSANLRFKSISRKFFTSCILMSNAIAARKFKFLHMPSLCKEIVPTADPKPQHP